MAKIVEVYSARDAAEAHLLVAMLAEHEIDGRVVGESLANGAGELPVGYTCAPRIWVREEHAAAAKELMRAWERRQSAPADDTNPGWTCSNCNRCL